jgi:hypothetical protein
VDCVDEIALVPGDEGELSGKRQYFTSAVGIRWARVPGLDALPSNEYCLVDVSQLEEWRKRCY